MSPLTYRALLPSPLACAKEDLAAAVNSRLPKPFDMEALEEELEIAEGESLTANDAANSYVIGEALDHLGFRQKGL